MGQTIVSIEPAALAQARGPLRLRTPLLRQMDPSILDVSYHKIYLLSKHPMENLEAITIKKILETWRLQGNLRFVNTFLRVVAKYSMKTWLHAIISINDLCCLACGCVTLSNLAEGETCGGSAKVRLET